jgi:hypothetical protein
MTQKLFDNRSQWTKHELLARPQRRWLWSIFRARVEVSFTEDHGTETVDVRRIQRRPARQPHLDRFSSRLMHSRQTSGQGRRIVGNHKIVRTKKIHERAPRYMNEIASFVNNEQFRVDRSLDGQLSG